MEEKEKEQLKNIISDKYAFGAFSGMIFNAIVSKHPLKNADMYIQMALRVRVRLLELASFETAQTPTEPKGNPAIEPEEDGHYEEPQSVNAGENLPYQEYKVTCSKCKKNTTVPFKPKYKRPVFCIDCYKSWRDRHEND